jgi:hypothetical protein
MSVHQILTDVGVKMVMAAASAAAGKFSAWAIDKINKNAPIMIGHSNLSPKLL